MKRIKACLLVLSAICLCSTLKAQIPSVFGATPVFDEEFNQSTLDTTKWAYRETGVTRGSCVNDPSAVTVANGYARISIYTANNAKGVSTDYCGALTTQANLPSFNGFQHSFGYWEASVRYKHVADMQTSFWIQSPTIGTPIGEPQQAGVEMDVFEHTSGNTDPNAYDHALEWDGYKQYYQTNAMSYSSSILSDGNFHLFALGWTPSGLTFYVDGVANWTITDPTVPISDALEYIILDTELPGATQAGGYGPLGSSSNGYLDIDYVKIFPYTPTVTMTTVGVVSDSYVQDTTPTTNYGSDVYLDSKLDPGGINRNIYLKFDLSNIKGTIKQATLFLKPLVIGTTNTIDTANYVSDNSWTESEITWSNAPKATSTLAAGMIYDAASGTFTNFNVGHNAVAGSEYSIQIVGKSPSGSSAYVGFSSKESTAPNAAVPQLFIVSTQ